MSATNTTTNLALSQFQNTDVPAWRTDYNGDMLKIDNAYAADISGATALSALEDTDYVKVYDTSASANKKTLVGDIVGMAGHFIAPVESSSTAANSYSVGDQLVYANALYDVTASITAGDSLVVGTNIALADDVSTTIKTEVGKREVLVLSSGTAVSALPYDFTNSAIETDMVCVNAVLGTPSAQTGDWTVSTDTAGTARVSGTISGSTTITLYLMKSR